MTTSWPPGGFDALNLHKAVYFADNDFHIPNIGAQDDALWPPPDLFPIRYAQQVRTKRPLFIHFHTADYRFENIWKDPARLIASAQRSQVWAVASPDYSLWADMPIAAQIWNTYRNRWVGRYLQQHRIHVIPSVNWSHHLSFSFCFLGLRQHQIVTIRTYSNLNDLESELFLNGYNQMIRTIQPRAILWFGHLDTAIITDNIPKFVFPIDHKKERSWAAEDHPEVVAELHHAEHPHLSDQ